MKNIATILVIFSSTVFHQYLCHPGGAPDTVCVSMTPSHGVAAQTTESPYKVTVENPYYIPKEKFKVSIESTTDDIKGFMIQARKVSDDTVVGEFDGSPTDTKYVECNNISKGAITHDKRLAVKKIEFEFEPSKSLTGNISFLATVVKDKLTFWVKVQSPELYMMTAPTTAPSTTPAPANIGSTTPASTNAPSPNTASTTAPSPNTGSTTAAPSNAASTMPESTTAASPNAVSPTPASPNTGSTTPAPSNTPSTKPPSTMPGTTTNSTCCDGTQLHYNVLFLSLTGLFLAFWQMV